MRPQILRARIKGVGYFPKRPDRQARIGQSPDTDRQIESLMDQVDKPIAEIRLDARQRISFQVGSDPSGHDEKPELHAARQS